MKQFKGYEDAKKAAQYSASEKLPSGAYICKILNVKYENGENGNSDRIKIQFDVAEGDYADFFKKQYDANTAEDKKFKGQTALYVPKDDGSEKDGWTKNSFAKWTSAFEDSNTGYVWDWDETKWKGLKVGIVFGETGNVIEGRECLYTEARFACSVQSIQEGKAPKAKFIAKNGYGTNQQSQRSSSDFVSIPDGEAEEIPFN